MVAPWQNNLDKSKQKTDWTRLITTAIILGYQNDI